MDRTDLPLDAAAILADAGEPGPDSSSLCMALRRSLGRTSLLVVWGGAWAADPGLGPGPGPPPPPAVLPCSAALLLLLLLPAHACSGWVKGG